MAQKLTTSRYDWQAFNGKSMSSFPAINPADLYNDDDFFVKLQYGQRIDFLAYKYLGDGHYWWLICLINGLKTPFDPALVAGKILRIPTSISRVIKILEEKSFA